MNPLEFTGHEKRITFQLYKYWFALTGERELPPLKDLDPADIAPYKDNMVLIDLRDPTIEPVLQVVGHDLKGDLKGDIELKALSDVPRKSLLSRITDHYLEVLANRTPISFDAEFRNKDDELTLYRGIMLPFSDDGSAINFILGAVRWVMASEMEDMSGKGEEAEPEKENMIPEAESVDENPTEEAAVAESPIEETSPEEILAEETSPEETSPEEISPEEISPEETSVEETPPAATEIPLKEQLAICRNLAMGQNPADMRSRKSLYETLGAIFDFQKTAEAAPEDFQAILKSEGLKRQKRAPFTPALKLCFGPDFDKTRLTEYAAALSYANKHITSGDQFAALIARIKGGIKGCVKAERQERRLSRGKKPREILEKSKKIINNLPVLGRLNVLEDTMPDNKADSKTAGGAEDSGNEFCLVLARRNGTVIEALKILDEKNSILEPIIKRAAKDP